jgi:hypothetical protein
VPGAPTSFDRAGTVGRVGTVLVLVLLVARFAQVGLSTLRAQVATLAAQDRVLTIQGGDVSLRDAPKAHELRRGRFFTDPYYAGEHHWYPFLTPLVAATVSRLGTASIPVAFFRAEVFFIALYLISLGALAFALARWPGLLFLPAVFWLGLDAGNGLYPTEAARGGFCLFLIGAGWLWERRTLTPRMAAGLGAAVGVLGLWNGASFFAAGALAAILAVRSILANRQAGRRALRFVPFLVLGAGLPLALLFAPQLLRHGRLAVPDAARTWLAPTFTGGTPGKVLTLALAPRGLHLMLVLAALLPLVRRLALARPRALPLLIAYFGCLLFAHLGFLQADGAHPLLARAATSLLPAPAHTFLATAEACRPVVEILGLLALAQLALRAMARLGLVVPAGTGALIPALALATSAALFFTFPYRITRFSSSETRGFDQFVQEVAAQVGDTPVFFRYPGRMLQSGSLKILKLSVPQYANPYAHADRTRAEQAIDNALRNGDVDAADAELDRYRIGFVMEDPRAPGDPVIRRCAGAPLAQQDGYILRKREHCQK